MSGDRMIIMDSLADELFFCAMSSITKWKSTIACSVCKGRFALAHKIGFVRDKTVVQILS